MAAIGGEGGGSGQIDGDSPVDHRPVPGIRPAQLGELCSQSSYPVFSHDKKLPYSEYFAHIYIYIL